MKATDLDHNISASKITFAIASLCSLLLVLSESAMAAIFPAIRTNLQFTSKAPAPIRYIVRHSQGAAGINFTCSLLGCQVVEAIGDADGQLFVVQTSGLISSPAFLAQLLALSGVVDAELDQNAKTPSPSYGDMPWYANDRTPVSYYGATVWEGYVIQTPNQIIGTAHTQSNFAVSGSGVRVAMIDTGIDPSNQILAPHLVDGYDFTRNTAGGSEMGDLSQSTAGVVDQSSAGVIDQSSAGVIDQSSAGVIDQSSAGVIDQSSAGVIDQSSAGVIDQSSAGVIDGLQYSAFGHGTMTAGIVHLVAPNAWLMPLKTFNASGTGYASDVLRAIYYAVNHQAKVINMSFEFTSPSLELANAVTYATGNNVICVGSAGNNGSMAIVYPSGLPNVIDVASTSNTNTPSWFSNYGTPPVWISAPGEAVMTTYPYGAYAVGWGTSFSAPFVSGTVALMASAAPGSFDLLNQTTAAQALSHAQPIPQTQYGFGVLDTYQAVQAWRNLLSVNVTVSCSGLSCQSTIH